MASGFEGKRISKCTVHNSVRAEIETLLSSKGCFTQKEVIDSLNLGGAVSKAINWKTLIRNMEEEMGIELIPVTEAYFKREKRYSAVADETGEHIGYRDDVLIMPEKFIAGGAGKPTAGFVLFTDECPAKARLGFERQSRLKAQEAGTIVSVIEHDTYIEGRIDTKKVLPAFADPPLMPKRPRTAA